jgi:hypothetical protein
MGIVFARPASNTADQIQRRARSGFRKQKNTGRGIALNHDKSPLRCWSGDFEMEGTKLDFLRWKENQVLGFLMAA